MAEAFGLAASVLSVASLAIQLGDSLQKAYEFWESIEDGPDDIRRISTELRWLANFLGQIQREHNSGAIDPLQEQLVKGALEIAKRDVDALAGVISELSRAIGPDQTKTRKRWGRVRIVLKGGTMAKMKGYIESSKSILNLLQTSRTQSAVCQMNGKLDILTATVSTQMHNHMTTTDLLFGAPPPYQGPLQMGTICSAPVSRGYSDGSLDSMTKSHDSIFDSRIQTKTSLKSIDAGVGVLTLRSTTAKALRAYDDTEKNGDEFYSKTFVINFLWRFASCRRGFRLSTSNTFDSWSFNTICYRPADSRIFDLCKSGNTFGVGDLLKYGMASVFDADPHGATPLHYACKYGHSNLARLLVDRGADIHARTNDGNAPIEYLEDYDRYQDVKNRENIAQIVDTMIRYADFDPFDWEDPSKSFDTLTLWNGLPWDNLRHLFAQNAFYATPEQRFDFILGNLLQLRDSIESSQECIDLLLVEYEKLQSGTYPNGGGWRYNFTLLQHLVFHWLDRSEGLGRGPALKISHALKLTNDLWRRGREGTALDTVARYDGSMVGRWLKLLSQNEIDLYEYGHYEQAQHLDGFIDQGPDICCRIIEVKFKFPEVGETLAIEIKNICDPRYEHLDSEYRCATSRRRELCISQMDGAFIGDDGKPLATMPGSWTQKLKPNSELPVALKFYEHGWQYTDFLEAPYKLWDEDLSGSTSQDSVDLESISGDDNETLDTTEDEAGEIARGMEELSTHSQKGDIDKEPTQKSPHSGREAPGSKSPCSGKETPDEKYPHSKVEGPTQRSPRSGKEAPIAKSPKSGKNDQDRSSPHCIHKTLKGACEGDNTTDRTCNPSKMDCEKVPCLKKAYNPNFPSMNP